MLIDTHCHLNKNYFNNIDNVIETAKKHNVKKIIICACEKKDFNESIEICNKYNDVYLSLGFHPSEVDNVSEKDLLLLKKILKSNSKIIALGEIGLDYYYNKKNKEKQIQLFENQLKLAEELALPVIIHSRDSFQDTYDILKKYHITGVIHCFSGNLENANMYLRLGLYLGIGGVVTFKNSHLKEVIKHIPLDRIVFETDSPFLTPEPYRGSINMPCYVKDIADYVSSIKNIDINEVERVTTGNVKSLFDLKD